MAGSAYLGSAGLTAAEGARMGMQSFGRMSGQNAVNSTVNTTSKAIVPYVAPKAANPTLYVSPTGTVTKELPGLATGLTGKEVAKNIGRDSALFGASNAFIHGGVTYVNNTDVLEAMQHGALNGVTAGGAFGIGSAAAKSAGLGKYGQIGTGIISSIAVPKPYTPMENSELATN